VTEPGKVHDDEYYEELAKELAGEDAKPELLHDLKLVAKAWDTYSFGPKPSWHNTAFEMIQASLLTHDTAPPQLVVAVKVFGLEAFLMALVNTAFGAGYILGEGPEHIHQCMCDRSDLN